MAARDALALSLAPIGAAKRRRETGHSVSNVPVKKIFHSVNENNGLDNAP